MNTFSKNIARAATVPKIPKVSAMFWVIKILTTGAGETTSDYLARTFEPLLIVGLAAVAVTVALAAQIWTPAYGRWRYWLAVTLIAVFGTMAADILHVVLGVPYALSTAGFMIVLAIVLATWRLVEGTLSIHSITGVRQQVFYWTTIGATFALGTALGDFTATSLHLGYFMSGVLFAACISAPALWFLTSRRLPIASFWSAYIVTRPLGASFSDWLGVPAGRGGLGLGTGIVSLALLLLIVLLVASSSRLPAPQVEAWPD